MNRIYKFIICVSVLLIVIIGITGCSTINYTKCNIQDTAQDRVIVSNIVNKVALDCDMKKVSQDYSNVINGGVVDISKYRFASESGLIYLSCYVWNGYIITSLSQLKSNKNRTQQYLDIQKKLIDQFKCQYSDAVKLHFYDEEQPL